jgi:hypothetical protein
VDKSISSVYILSGMKIALYEAWTALSNRQNALLYPLVTFIRDLAASCLNPLSSIRRINSKFDDKTILFQMKEIATVIEMDKYRLEVLF